MGTKILYVGLTLLLAGPKILSSIPSVDIVGAVIMVIGCILVVLDK